jgi:excisionase family DNA binding protein
MNPLLSTKEVARLLNVNEKMVYTLVAEKGLPASKVTGKWLFPRHLVEQWVETQTINYPDTGSLQPTNSGRQQRSIARPLDFPVQQPISSAVGRVRKSGQHGRPAGIAAKSLPYRVKPSATGR